MARKLVWTTKVLAASCKATGERTLARMCAHVLCQIGALWEGTATSWVGANKWLFSSVRASVDGQAACHSKRFSAAGECAQVWLLFRMCPFVLLERIGLGEELVADVALKWTEAYGYS